MDDLATRDLYFGGGAGWLHLVVRGTHFGVASPVGEGPGAGREGGVRRRGVEMVPGKVKSPKSYRTT